MNMVRMPIVITRRRDYERLKAAEQALEAYRTALKAAVEIARSAVELMSHL